jgi:hypothetical protein
MALLSKESPQNIALVEGAMQIQQPEPISHSCVRNYMDLQALMINGN